MNKEIRFKNSFKIGNAIGLAKHLLDYPENTKDKVKELIEILDSIEV